MKQIAQTLKDAACSEAMRQICDRTKPVPDELVSTITDHWQYDLFSRSPRPALLENGALKVTDLDLACFLSALVDRKAVINLPTYESRRAKTHREGERVISSQNRHGQVLGLTANKETFSFSVKVLDMNVIQQSEAGDKVGAPRNFMLVDLTGSWRPGWRSIEFMPNRKENDFLNDKNLWTGNSVVFNNFVHPNRWVSFYGQYYFMTKALIQRLEEENKFRRKVRANALHAGIEFPKTGYGSKEEWPETTKGESNSIKVHAFEAEVDVPMEGEYNIAIGNSTDIVTNEQIVHHYQYEVLPALRFATRTTELAFVKSGYNVAGWIKGAKWESGYREKGKRTDWDRLVLTQLFPGQQGIAIRMRQYEKTEQVAL